MGYRRPARVNERRGHSMGERGRLAPERTLGEQEPWPQRLLLPPQARAMGPGPGHRNPGSPQGNAFSRHPGRGALISSQRRGFEL